MFIASVLTDGAPHREVIPTSNGDRASCLSPASAAIGSSWNLQQMTVEFVSMADCEKEEAHNLVRNLNFV